MLNFTLSLPSVHFFNTVESCLLWLKKKGWVNNHWTSKLWKKKETAASSGNLIFSIFTERLNLFQIRIYSWVILSKSWATITRALQYFSATFSLYGVSMHCVIQASIQTGSPFKILNLPGFILSQTQLDSIKPIPNAPGQPWYSFQDSCSFCYEFLKFWYFYGDTHSIHLVGPVLSY